MEVLNVGRAKLIDFLNDTLCLPVNIVTDIGSEMVEARLISDITGSKRFLSILFKAESNEGICPLAYAPDEVSLNIMLDARQYGKLHREVSSG